jgi:hypothetical protein
LTRLKKIFAVEEAWNAVPNPSTLLFTPKMPCNLMFITPKNMGFNRF